MHWFVQRSRQRMLWQRGFHEPSLNEDSPDKSSVWGFCNGMSTSWLLASLDLDKKISISYISIRCVTCVISSTCTASPFHLQYFKIETLAPSWVPASFLLLWDMTNDENMGMSLSHAHVIEFCLIPRYTKITSLTTHTKFEHGLVLRGGFCLWKSWFSTN